uniref:Tudor domain-containing protein n=1 Tax=Gongylonema pulchrum TaxID=637853 RepID=A0A183ESX7_9BILA
LYKEPEASVPCLLLKKPKQWLQLGNEKTPYRQVVAVVEVDSTKYLAMNILGMARVNAFYEKLSVRIENIAIKCRNKFLYKEPEASAPCLLLKKPKQWLQFGNEKTPYLQVVAVVEVDSTKYLAMNILGMARVNAFYEKLSVRIEK